MYAGVQAGGTGHLPRPVLGRCGSQKVERWCPGPVLGSRGGHPPGVEGGQEDDGPVGPRPQGLDLQGPDDRQHGVVSQPGLLGPIGGNMSYLYQSQNGLLVRSTVRLNEGEFPLRLVAVEMMPAYYPESVRLSTVEAFRFVAEGVLDTGFDLVAENMA